MGSASFSPQPVNWRWLMNIARTRGLPAPDAAALRSAVVGLAAEVDAQLRQAAAAACGGTDTPEQLEWLATWLRNVKQSAEVAEPLSASRTREDAVERQAEDVSFTQDHPLKWSHKVFGATAALCIEVAHVHSEDGGRGEYWTVRLEFARALGDGKYAWDRKETFRLDKRELYLLAAFTYGDITRFELGGHGPRHNKRLCAEDQGDKLYLSFKQGAKSIGVPITSADVPEFSARVLHAVQSNLLGLGDYSTRALIRRAAQLELVAQEARLS